MPIASFKVEVTSDLGPLENGNIVDIKRQTVSIVIDGLNEDVFVDKAFKQQVFQTVAGSVGYIRGRDSIQLSIAEFPIYTESEKKALIAKHTRQGFIQNMLMIVSVIIAGIIIMMIIRYIINKRKEKKSLIEDVDDNEFEMIDDLGKKDDSIKESNNKKLEQVKELAQTTPEKLATIMEDWLKEQAIEYENAEEELVLEEASL
tara:strand:- start:862 stop:1470 length:609 start_codon:yes stop_codon:yes gene_type:complete